MIPLDIIFHYIGLEITNNVEPYMGIKSDNCTKWENFEGGLHRINGPAIIHDEPGFKVERWLRENKPYREKGPTCVRYESNQIIFESYITEGKLHRVDGPAYILRYPNGAIKQQEWYYNGEKHRENAPAHIEYYNTGQVAGEYWYQNNKLHRIDAAALTEYSSDGSISLKEYYRNDQLESSETTEHQTGSGTYKFGSAHTYFRNHCWKSINIQNN